MMQLDPGQTRTETMKPCVRSIKMEHPLPSIQSEVQWCNVPKKRAGEHLFRNLTVASAVMLCAVALRQGAIPELSGATDAILTAVTNDDLLRDDSLGKLSFVSSLFPEAQLVFGEMHRDMLQYPVDTGEVVHVWSEAEPYLAWRTGSTQVTAGTSGEVIGVYHGNGDERLVQILGEQGLACLYGNLEEVCVSIGDKVSAGDMVGTLLSGKEFVLEVRRNGVNVDPAQYLP